ncbi:MAG: DinB family protein [Acidobacteria bacterium]|nr:DinB family protein [Acidobacteriota bacterium]
MTQYGGGELAAAFRTVRRNTLRIAEEIPEEMYSFRPAEGTRTVAEMLSHIAHAPRFQQEVTLTGRNNLDGFNYMQFISAVMAESNKPRTKAELLDLLKAEGEKFAAQLESLSHEFLNQHITFPPGGDPPSRSRFDLLMSVKEHEMHHRGQLMLIQRLLGQTPHLTREAEARRAAMIKARK